MPQRLTPEWTAWIRAHSEPRLPEPHGFYWSASTYQDPSRTSSAERHQAARAQIQQWLHQLADGFQTTFPPYLAQDMRHALSVVADQCVTWLGLDAALPSLPALVLVECVLHDGPIVVVTGRDVPDFWPHLQQVCPEIPLDALARRIVLVPLARFVFQQWVGEEVAATELPFQSRGSLLFHACGRPDTPPPPQACPPHDWSVLGARVLFHRCYPSQSFWASVVGRLRIREWKLVSGDHWTPTDEHLWNVALHGRCTRTDNRLHGCIDDWNWVTSHGLPQVAERSVDDRLVPTAPALAHVAALHHSMGWRVTEDLDSLEVLGDELTGGQMVVQGDRDLHVWMERAGFQELRLAEVLPQPRATAAFRPEHRQPCYVVVHEGMTVDAVAMVLYLYRLRSRSPGAVGECLGCSREVDLRWLVWQWSPALAPQIHFVLPAKAGDVLVLRDVVIDPTWLLDAVATQPQRRVWKLGGDAQNNQELAMRDWIHVSTHGDPPRVDDDDAVSLAAGVAGAPASAAPTRARSPPRRTHAPHFRLAGRRRQRTDGSDS